jgi:hypothetical protein
MLRPRLLHVTLGAGVGAVMLFLLAVGVRWTMEALPGPEPVAAVVVAPASQVPLAKLPWVRTVSNPTALRVRGAVLPWATAVTVPAVVSVPGAAVHKPIVPATQKAIVPAVAPSAPDEPRPGMPAATEAAIHGGRG